MLIKPKRLPRLRALSRAVHRGKRDGVACAVCDDLWDYINRAMPFRQEGSLKPDEVYALTAFMLYKNGVIQEDEVLDAQSLPEVKMPNRDGYAIPDWKPGMPRPFPNKH